MEENKYLRVTDIIKRLMPPIPSEIEAIVKAKGEIGTCVHTLIDNYLQGVPLFYGAQSREEAFFESWRMWYEAKRPEILMQESRLFCDDLMITGQVDAVMQMGGDLVLVDYKTSSAEGKLSDGSSSWNMQAHFYHYLLQRNFFDISDRMIFLQLRERKDIFLISEDKEARIKPTELSKMISSFDEADRKVINEKIRRVGEFEFEEEGKKRKILVQYTPKIANIFEYNNDKNIGSRCIEETKKAWKEIQ